MDKKTGVVVVPGIMGSELICSKAFSYQKFGFKKGELLFLGQDPFKPSLEALMCNSEGTSVYPIEARETTSEDSHFGVLGLYTQIIEALKGDGRIGKVFFFSYDWRLSLWELSKRLERFVEEKNLEKVVFVAHSLGGLLASRFIADHPERVERLVSLGTPFCGAPAVLYALETGNYFGGWKSFLNIPVSSSFKRIAKNFESVYTLLPAQEYIESVSYILEHGCKTAGAVSDSRLFNRGILKPSPYIKMNINEVGEFLGRRPWMNKALQNSAQRFQKELYAGGTHAAFTVDSYFIIGYGKETVTQLAYLNRLGFYYFDRAIEKNEGDGLVTLQSATMFGQTPQDRTFYFNQEHNGMLNDSGIIALVCDIAAGAERRELNKFAAVLRLEMQKRLKREDRPGPLFKRAAKLRNRIRFARKDDNVRPKLDFSLNGGWQRADVRVKLFDAGGRSDLWKIEYRLNDGPITLYGAPFTVSQEGINKVAAVAYDKEGNMSYPVLFEVKIDKTAPEIMTGPLPETVEKGSFINMTYSAVDSHSGVESVTATFNGRPFESGEMLVIENSGANIIEITAFDNAGNGSMKSIAIMAEEGL